MKELKISNMFKKLLNRKKRKLLKAQRNEPLPHNREAFFSINNIKVISTYTELKNCQVIANTRFVISENEKLFFTSGSLPNYTFQEALQKWVLCEEDFSNCKYYEDDGKISFWQQPLRVKLRAQQHLPLFHGLHV